MTHYSTISLQVYFRCMCRAARNTPKEKFYKTSGIEPTCHCQISFFTSDPSPQNLFDFLEGRGWMYTDYRRTSLRAQTARLISGDYLADYLRTQTISSFCFLLLSVYVYRLSSDRLQGQLVIAAQRAKQASINIVRI